MRKFNYSITPKAVRDLEEIRRYTVEKWSVEQADRYYMLIIDEFEFLCKNPNAGKPVDLVLPGYRSSLVKSHVIFYRLIKSNRLEIVRVLHQNMDKNQIME